MKKLLLVLLLVASQPQAWAQKPKIVASDKSGWHKIGETTVDYKTETDEILVIGANRFKSLQVKVTTATVNLESINISFDKGENQSVAIGKEIKAPGESRIIDLTGTGERNVKKVVFKYKTLSTAGDSNKKARVELWGLKT
ncbi:hypothetical protein FMM05_15485 [Flavobacterium zepuense]|uniref:DUF2541 domain containing protein n=1 Tax=Flavobacterium zepuense TaxID=2593302 RepID=A0A552UXZ9_9FLAO|nr:hypothetical protein [Flavobacterium zepuense]TRW23091.1 hypothetical protein FMM05_15485 [Flavobacterium zepuense]